MADYARPEMLVSTDGVAQHLHAPGLRIVAVEVDTSAYEQGHIPGAVGWTWQTQLCDQLRRDLLTKEQFEPLMHDSGISPTTTIVFSGEHHTWFAISTLWQCRYWGHPEDQLQVLNGGRAKWGAEGRPLVPDRPASPRTSYRAAFPDDNVRATKDVIFHTLLDRNQYTLGDVRSPEEFTGQVIAPPGQNETAQRGGHIPGAQAVKEDSTCKSADELRALYAGKGVDLSQETVAYCHIGERSSHTWCVLKDRLGAPKVRNDDGSWTEWGNLVGAPILALPDATGNLAFVTLRGGGLFVVNPRTTPMQIVAEYTNASVQPAGLLATQSDNQVYFNSGGGGAELGHQAILYQLPVDAFSPTPDLYPASDTPAPTVVFDHGDRDVKDSHGLVLTRRGRYLWVADRAANPLIVVDTRTNAVVNEINMSGGVSPDPAPDILDVAPGGGRVYVTLRGPHPLTGNNPAVNNAQGQTPGLGLIRVNPGGKDASVRAVVPISNFDRTRNQERADRHGLAVCRR